jgi:hypothetical protein
MQETRHHKSHNRARQRAATSLVHDVILIVYRSNMSPQLAEVKDWQVNTPSNLWGVPEAVQSTCGPPTKSDVS